MTILSNAGLTKNRDNETFDEFAVRAIREHTRRGDVEQVRNWQAARLELASSWNPLRKKP